MCGQHSRDVGLDVAKREIVACLRWGEDDFERLGRLVTRRIGELVQLLIVTEKLEVVVALESTARMEMLCAWL